MDYYDQLEAALEGYLTHFREDFEQRDREALEGFRGEFLLGARETGTNLLRFDGETRADDQTEGLFEGQGLRFGDVVDQFLFHANERFFHGKDGVVMEVSAAKARRIYERAVNDGRGFFA